MPQEFQVHPLLHPYNVPSSTYLASLPPSPRPSKLVVGVLLPSPLTKKILLLKRSENELHYPGIWELPSGKVESGDLTILHAAARECEEETGLSVAEFTALGNSFEYSVEGRGRTLQLNFDVRTQGDGDEVRINSEEHQGFKWCDWGEVEEIGVTERMRGYLRDAFVRWGWMDMESSEYVFVRRGGVLSGHAGLHGE